MTNRFNSFKKGISKFKNISPKIKGNLNHKFNKKKSKDSNHKSSIEYIVPENSPLRKNAEENNEFYSSDYSDDFSEAIDDIYDDYDFIEDSTYDLDEIDKKYAKYIFGDNGSDEEYIGSKNSYLNEDSGDINDLSVYSESNGKYNKNYDYFDGNYSNDNFNNDLDNNDEILFHDGLENDAIYKNNSGSKYDSKDIKTKLMNFRKNLLDNDDRSKSRFGKIAFILIFLVLASSIFYFFVYQPFQDELNLERNAKLNELNTLYKGPLEAHENAYTLKSQIESENDISELKLIDIMMYATKDWRNYHSSKIVSSKDNFGRVMLVYGDENKNIIMSVKDANDFVKDNDAKVLSNIQFEKVDTTIVPISISRLQATAGLISVGSIVDIYSLNDNYSDYGSDSDLDSSQSINESSSSDVSDDNQDLSNGESGLNSDSTGLEGSEDSSLDASNGEDSSLAYNSVDENPEETSEFSSDEEPDVSGATVLAILRSKDSGVIDSSISQSNTFIKGNTTTPYENTSSYSNDVEELLKASVFNSYDNEKALESYLDGYGIKLSNYERTSNLADLDSEYLVLLEVPRSDVNFIINNMDSLILTIPTEFAPNWVVSELNETYYDNIYNYDSNSSFFG